MGMVNIYVIWNSFQYFWVVCSQMLDFSNWLLVLESIKWLQYLLVMLKVVVLVVNIVDWEGWFVLVYCFDGWDCILQIVVLVKILLDLYYRMLEGF